MAAMPYPSEPFTIGDYLLKSKLGESSVSIVWEAESKSSGEVVAVKQVFISKLNRHLANCLDCELNFLSSVNHPNIIRLLHVLQSESCLFLVLEFCAGGNLASYIRSHGRIQEELARRFMQQLGAGLEVLQSHHIIHRDLKPENILLSGSKEDLVLKIADFGLSRNVDPGKYAQTVCGSHCIWRRKFYNSNVMMRRLTCGVLVQFFSSFLMATHLSRVELMFSCCRILSHLHAFHFLSSFFQNYIPTVSTYVQDFFL
ncbi:hypothetical protein V6N12_022139 [Hibiscus sabdariffa]|uniref:Protein kinase domain-containing protein n=1 Tax=Hibiscus sabdariffa TaxID=183260 RepID=A0ABR2FTV1_9ROSI